MNLFDPSFNLALLAFAVNNGRAFFVRHHPAGPAQHRQSHAVQFFAGFLGNDFPAGQNSDVLKHFLSAVAKTRGLNGQRVKGAAKFVDNQSGQRFAVNVFGDDDHFLFAALGHRFQNRHDLGHGGDLFVGDQNVGIVIFGDHFFGVGHQISRDIAFVKLHAFYHFVIDAHRL